MNRPRQTIDATKLGEHGLRLIGTTDIDGKGTAHEIASVDPIVLFDYGKINTRYELPFRPHPHFGLTAMSFLPLEGTWMAWDSLNGESESYLQAGGLYYVHAGLPAFHHEFPSPETVAAEMEVEFVQLVWNATDEKDVRTVIIQPEDVPVIHSENSGELFGVKSIQPFTHRKIIYAYIQLQIGKTIEIPMPSSFRGILFVMEGKLKVDGLPVDEQQMMIFGDEEQTLSIDNDDAGNVARFIIAAGEPVNKPFYKLIGLGGFIIGETEKEVRRRMEDFGVTAEQLKKEIPQHFPAQYL
jgi:redox-sensitive bicupin YhaK (pirin superfamily)